MAHCYNGTQTRQTVIFSNVSKIVILIEITCPCEENVEDRHHEKLTKYNLLKEQIISNGWDCYLYAIEVGARKLCLQSCVCLCTCHVLPFQVGSLS